MTYVVTENCIKCKYMDCVEVCPVDCFYEGENMPSSIRTSASTAASASPNARPRRSSPTPNRALESWLQLNGKYAATWPNITQKKEPPADAKEFDGVPGKLEMLSPDPGEARLIFARKSHPRCINHDLAMPSPGKRLPAFTFDLACFALQARPSRIGSACPLREFHKRGAP